MPNFKPTWTPVRDFVDSNTGVCVRVNKTNHQIPQYSFETGRLRDVGNPKSFIPFLLVRVDREDVTSGKTDDTHIEVLHELLDTATDWAEEEISATSDKFREKRERQASAGDEDSGYAVQQVSRENRGNRRRQSVSTETVPPSEPAPASAAA